MSAPPRARRNDGLGGAEPVAPKPPATAATAGKGPPPESRRTRIVCLAVLALVVAFASWVRIHYTLTDRNFDAVSADGLLRSDPALVYYITERIVDGGGLPPADFRGDPRVTWPDPADLPAMFTVGQEFLVAWTWLAFGGGKTPLHVWCLYVMSIVASLAAVGVFGLAFELSRSMRWAAVAAVLYALVPFNYRTIGVLLLREDLSLPLFMLHLWLLARAARCNGLGAWIGAGLAVAAALATWHAMAFVVTLEVVTLLAWFVRTGESPFDRARAWIVPAIVAAASLAVPVLWAKGFLLSPAMLATGAMLAVSLVDRRRVPGPGPAGPASPSSSASRVGWSHARRVGVALGAVAVALVAVRLSGVQKDYGHVFGFLAAKLRHLGAFPQDPASVSFDVRLLWQGPFMTAKLGADVARGLGGAAAVALIAILVAVPGWWRGKGDRTFLLAAGFCVVAALAGWMVVRTLVLIALVAPALAVAIASRIKPATMGIGLVTGLFALQLWMVSERVQEAHGSYVGWYAKFPWRNAELADVVRWSRRNLPADEGVLSDYVTSTSLLAANRNGIVCQPKYETAASRKRIEEFCQAFLRGTPADVRALAVRYRCRYVVVDKVTNLLLLGYPAGYPVDGSVMPGPDSAAAAFDEAAEPPGFRLLYRTPARLYPPASQGAGPWDSYRVYEIVQ